MSTADPLGALAKLDGIGWLVGGAVRDRLLGRPTADFDVAVLGDAGQLARALARATHAHVFSLSEGFRAWRVVARDHSWQVDVLPVAGGTIETDLAHRDFTVNALAEPLAGGEPVAPPRAAGLRARVRDRIGNRGRGAGERRRTGAGGARADLRRVKADRGRRARGPRARPDGAARGDRRGSARAERIARGAAEQVP